MHLYKLTLEFFLISHLKFCPCSICCLFFFLYPDVIINILQDSESDEDVVKPPKVKQVGGGRGKKRVQRISSRYELMVVNMCLGDLHLIIRKIGLHTPLFYLNPFHGESNSPSDSEQTKLTCELD